jgi:hypothetical protein
MRMLEGPRCSVTLAAPGHYSSPCHCNVLPLQVYMQVDPSAMLVIDFDKGNIDRTSPPSPPPSPVTLSHHRRVSLSSLGFPCLPLSSPLLSSSLPLTSLFVCSRVRDLWRPSACTHVHNLPLCAVKVAVLADGPDVGTSAYDLTIVGGAKKRSAVHIPPRSMCNGTLSILRLLELVRYHLPTA